MVMLDLQKAFDTVQHDILLQKLRALGFDSASVQWIRSYLENRLQMVDINGTLSSLLPLKCGVPQGSILGPLLFLIYVNDMKSACDCNLFLFADDAALLVSHKEKSVVETLLSSELKKISIWLADNKLSLHLGKTESILFASKIKLKQNPGLKILVGNTVIQTKKEITYLGCILDENLSGESMALRVISKANQRIKFLARISKFIDKGAMKILAAALIQCHFDYACTSWYNGIPITLKNKLQTSQNKLVRLIHTLHPRTHLLPTHFNSLGWLRVKQRVSFLKMCMVHRIIQNKAPRYFNKYFLKVCDVHKYSTRGSATDFIPCKVNTSIGKASFLFSAAMTWNSLPNVTKLIQSTPSFKSSLKSFLNTTWT